MPVPAWSRRWRFRRGRLSATGYCRCQRRTCRRRSLEALTSADPPPGFVIHRGPPDTNLGSKVGLARNLKSSALAARFVNAPYVAPPGNAEQRLGDCLADLEPEQSAAVDKLLAYRFAKTDV